MGRKQTAYLIIQVGDTAYSKKYVWHWDLVYTKEECDMTPLLNVIDALRYFFCSTFYF